MIIIFCRRFKHFIIFISYIDTHTSFRVHMILLFNLILGAFLLLLSICIHKGNRDLKNENGNSTLAKQALHLFLYHQWLFDVLQICCRWRRKSHLRSNRKILRYIKIPGKLNGVCIWVEVCFYILTTWWMSLLVYQRVPKGTCSQVL